MLLLLERTNKSEKNEWKGDGIQSKKMSIHKICEKLIKLRLMKEKEKQRDESVERRRTTHPDL